MSAAAEVFRQAAQLNRTDPGRTGNLLRLDGDADVIVCGDIHGNRKHLAKVITYADLARNPRRCLVLQELLHSPPDGPTGQDRSADVLLRAARLKTTHPRQVYFVLANHDVAQVSGGEIIKDGRRICSEFMTGLKFAFGDDVEDVREAMWDFLLSMPLAVLCGNGVMISHSLPNPRHSKRPPADALTGPYRPEDLHRGGRVYEWTWSRGHTHADMETLAAALDANFFVMGHHHGEHAVESLGPRGLTITSDDAHGMLLHFSTSEPLTAQKAEFSAKSIASLG